MSIPAQEEVNNIAKEFIKLREKAKKSKSKKVKKKFEDYQNYAATRLSHLVLMKSNRYKKFSNYYDLTQDGFEALILALKTYNPNKGDFTWWARKYIDTRISRAANAHSTIRFPLKKAKETQPYKTNSLPILIDSSDNPLDHVESAQLKKVVTAAINRLPEDQKRVIMLAFEFNGNKSSSVSSISKELDISRPTCVRLLEEAKTNLKNNLLPLINEA